MPEVGVKELQTRASEILRDVREKHMSYVITYRGRPTGLLVPFDENDRGADSNRTLNPDDEVWNRLTHLGEKIAQKHGASRHSTDILSEMRR